MQLSNRNPYFYRFRYHHPLITQRSAYVVKGDLILKSFSLWLYVPNLYPELAMLNLQLIFGTMKSFVNYVCCELCSTVSKFQIQDRDLEHFFGDGQSFRD